MVRREINNKKNLSRAPFSSSLFLILFFISIASSSLTKASQARKVLIIGMDGCRSDALQQANIPYIDSLISTGLFSYDSWHLGITISGPSWSTIMTGTWWNKHGVKGNSYANSNFNSYPYFTKRAKELKPNLYCVEISEWDPLINSVYNDGMNRKFKTEPGGDSTTAEAIRQLRDTSLDCLFTYYEAVDRAGHASGFSPGNSNYISAIEYVDAQVGILMQALKARPNYANEDWLVLLITDHGGTGLAHGGNSYVERHIWWIASGSAVTAGQISEADPGTYNFLGTGIFNSLGVNKTLMRQSPVLADIAVTALHHLIYDTGINPMNQSAWKLDGKSWLNNTIGMNELADESGIKIFPNPSNGLVTCWMNSTEAKNKVIQIWNMQGSLAKLIEVPENTRKVNMDLSDLPNGMYILKVNLGDKIATRKMELIH